jgi:hypothetical protein
VAEREDARADPHENWDGKREESSESSSTATDAASSLSPERKLGLKELATPAGAELERVTPDPDINVCADLELPQHLLRVWLCWRP